MTIVKSDFEINCSKFCLTQKLFVIKSIMIDENRLLNKKSIKISKFIQI